VRVEIIVHGRGRNGVRGWTFANRAFLLAKACRLKVSNDAREWTHHDHTASELPDNTRNV